MASEQCTASDNKCKANSYCPADDDSLIDCKACDDQIDKYSCNCVNNKQTANCQSCESGVCKKCKTDFTLTTDKKSCLKSLDSGFCNGTENKCLVDTFCPASTDDKNKNTCKLCTETITAGFGCNCVADTPTPNCKSCASGKCSACIEKYALKNEKCEACSGNCLECTDSATCTKCEGKFAISGTKTCEACSANCLECETPGTCSKCDDSYFVDGSNVCQACGANCSACSDDKTCTTCDVGFKAVNGVCKADCDDKKACVATTEFCDLENKVCKECTTGCSKCKNESICGGCDKDMQLTIIGTCEKDCSAKQPTAGQYCKAGTATNCRVDIVSQCKCGEAKNCATCDATKTKCGDCLLGFKKNGDNCVQCDDGFETYETICLAPKLPAGKCSKASNSCAVDSYCPATNNTMTDCIPCDDNIKIWQGCNCVLPTTNTTPNRNCRTCADSKCTKCIKSHFLNESGTKCDVCDKKCADCNSLTDCIQCKPKFFLEDKDCKPCGLNCTTCTDATTCTVCAENFKPVNGVCTPICNAEIPCTQSTDYCDSATETCKSCPNGCSKCKNESICGACDATKILTIAGACEADCQTQPIAEGKFCDYTTGQHAECVPGLTSQCKCGNAQHCASCSADLKKCEMCIPGFKKDENKVCGECAEGFETYETLCLPVQKEESAKLSGGAIAGIVIGVLVIGGGVAGGLAYYFIKKGKTAVVESSTAASMQ